MNEVIPLRKFLSLLAVLLLLCGCAEVPEETVPEYVLTAGERAEFRKKIEPLYQQYCGEYMDLVDQIRNG